MSVKVLSIDDSKDILFAISAICELENWETITSTDGSNVEEIIIKHNPDIILIDYHMPMINGIEVVKKIRKINKFVPIIVLTVEEKRKIANEFMEAGASDFAIKPIRAIDLISRIKVHLKTHNNVECTNESYTKGISKKTKMKILNFLRENKGNHTIEDISNSVGLSYQTTHRYLVHFIENNLVVYEDIYGRQGRPKRIYKSSNN